MQICGKVPQARGEEQIRFNISNQTHTLQLPQRIHPESARASFTLTSMLLIILK